jgi:ATP-dependent RNA helicase DDX55/SPB4
MLLTDAEMSYVEFMQAKNVELKEFDTDESISKPLKSKQDKFERKVRKQMLTDRDFLIKGSKAYVSFIGSYIEHKLGSIFKLEDLDLPNTAKSFFLFRIPFIKELKELQPSVQIATDEELILVEQVKFKNKNQQKMIQDKIKKDRGKSKCIF